MHSVLQSIRTRVILAGTEIIVANVWWLQVRWKAVPCSWNRLTTLNCNYFPYEPQLAGCPQIFLFHLFLTNGLSRNSQNCCCHLTSSVLRTLTEFCTTRQSFIFGKKNISRRKISPMTLFSGAGGMMRPWCKCFTTSFSCKPRKSLKRR